VRLLSSSIQVVAEDHGFEKWMNIPAERERLFKLLRDTKVAGVICLSGDRHLAELSMMDAGIGYPLYDLTSSGLNQGFKNWRPAEKNRHRVATMPFGDNFGLITIDWSEDPKISLQIRDVGGDVAIQHKLRLSDLQPRDAFAIKVKPSEPDVKPTTEGAITATDALKKVGEKVTVEMKVQSFGGNSAKRLFLNSRAEFRDEGNLTVVVLPPALTGKYAKATGATFHGKVIRVNGTVTTFNEAPQIMVEDERQFEIIEAK
jgi:alkaline phosphatase D